MYSKLQYISQGNTFSEQLNNIQQALDAGCNWIQLRYKNATPQELEKVAEKVKSLCKEYNSVFIINDNVQLTKTIDADGVHLGLQDTLIQDARAILGADKIIGGTANTIADVLQRVNEGCNYIGLGPLRFTTTKEKLSPVLGVEGYKAVMEELKSQNISLPVYAIGGIVAEDIESIIKTGVHGIAVSGLITAGTNKKELVNTINNALHANT